MTSRRSTFACVSLDDGRLGGEVAVLHVDVLKGNRISLDQLLPALGCGARERRVCPCGQEIGPGLGQLLIDIRRLDFGEQLSSLD